MPDHMDVSCREFVDLLASRSPAPGGGGASAFVGALGMALGNMVGSLTVGKPKYADVEVEVVRLMEKADVLQDRLMDLVEADAEAFWPLSKAYGLPSSTEEEKLRKSEVMEECLRNACSVPLQIMHACCEAIDLHAAFAQIGAAIAISDVGCGVVICKSALQAASLNVFINTSSMRDRDYAQACEHEARAMLDSHLSKADEVFRSVEERIS